MREIKIKVRERDGEEFFVERVASIVSASPRPARQDDGYAWRLDDGNDWKLELRGDILVVAYRYGSGHEEMMDGLEAFLRWTIGAPDA